MANNIDQLTFTLTLNNLQLSLDDAPLKADTINNRTNFRVLGAIWNHGLSTAYMVTTKGTGIMYQSVSKYSSVDIGFNGTRLNTVVMQTSPETLLLIQSGTITLISFDFTTGTPNKFTATASYLSQQSIKRKATFRGS